MITFTAYLFAEKGRPVNREIQVAVYVNILFDLDTLYDVPLMSRGWAGG
jgi:hypothetical protein